MDHLANSSRNLSTAATTFPKPSSENRLPEMPKLKHVPNHPKSPSVTSKPPSVASKPPSVTSKPPPIHPKPSFIAQSFGKSVCLCDISDLFN